MEDFLVVAQIYVDARAMADPQLHGLRSQSSHHVIRNIPLSNIQRNADTPSHWSDTVTLYHSSRQLRRRTITKFER